MGAAATPNECFGVSFGEHFIAAAIMSLIRSAQLNGHEPHAYLKDVLTRLPTHKACDISALLPHRWQPTLIVG
ncbi:hypothetical protein PPGU19_025950 [Paraburkholderia sp. PGU19]|nr:hypothetical protein PPGU19_025950 [Paraburkholderia sp. PGU19]